MAVLAQSTKSHNGDTELSQSADGTLTAVPELGFGWNFRQYWPTKVLRSEGSNDLWVGFFDDKSCFRSTLHRRTVRRHLIGATREEVMMWLVLYMRTQAVGKRKSKNP